MSTMLKPWDVCLCREMLKYAHEVVNASLRANDGHLSRTVSPTRSRNASRTHYFESGEARGWDANRLPRHPGHLEELDFVTIVYAESVGLGELRFEAHKKLRAWFRWSLSELVQLHGSGDRYRSVISILGVEVICWHPPRIEIVREGFLDRVGETVLDEYHPSLARREAGAVGHQSVLSSMAMRQLQNWDVVPSNIVLVAAGWTAAVALGLQGFV
ncbi:hypothetical protein E4U14_002177 [Claviceps sp. LM454 group G7]|nr:hypothetical protein E4U14_002177 [Claviceps sp. LM454 group G7]